MALDLYIPYTLDNDENFSTYNSDFFRSEKSYISLSDYVFQNELKNILKHPTLKKYTRYFLLYDNEEIKKEITNEVIPGGSINKTLQNGQVQSSNISIINSYNNKILYNPLTYEDPFSTNIKIKIVSGIEYHGKQYEMEQGIFVACNPKININNANKVLDLQLYDKFALLDGTISGKEQLDYELSRGLSVYDAARLLLKCSKNSRGEHYDDKKIVFPAKHINTIIPYTIKKTGDNTIGEILKDLAASIACDLKYNSQGNLSFIDTFEAIDFHNRQVFWNFEKGEWTNPQININTEQIKNKITVVGTNINGLLCKGTIENNNPLSMFSTVGPFGERSQKISDNLLSSNSLCELRAYYELKKQLLDAVSINLQSIWIPYLEPGDLIRWGDPNLNIEEQEFLVKSISIPLNNKDNMSLSLMSLKELEMI